MNIVNYFTILIVLCIILYILQNKKLDEHEEFLNYTQCKKIPLSIRLDEIFKKNNIYRDDRNWDLYLPCGYTNVESEFKNIPKLKSHQKIFALDGCDKIVSKYYIWTTLKNTLGDSYINYFPRTYLCRNNGIRQLIKNHKTGMKYIAKKDVQRQTGLKIIHDIKNISKLLIDPKYIVIQELLNNPFIIDKRKINIRIYFLIICKNNNVSAYIHEEGFIYYTPKEFDYKSSDKNAHITTGYIDRNVYKINPLTIGDLYRYINTRGYNSDTLRNNIINLFKNLINALRIPICNSKKLNKGTAFQLFGCDVAPDNKLGVKLIEINKGPDLSSKSRRDNNVKNEVAMDLLEKVEIINKQHKENRFIKIK